MLESLDINGRRYVPVDRAAYETGYAASYIVRLARDKWIDASFVQGECFVDVDSFNVFVATVEADVYGQLRKTERRKQAAAAYAAYQDAQAELAGEDTIVIVGKVGAVMLCSMLALTLALTSVDAGVTLADMAAGAVQVGSVIMHEVVPSGGWFHLLP